MRIMNFRKFVYLSTNQFRMIYITHKFYLIFHAFFAKNPLGRRNKQTNKLIDIVTNTNSQKSCAFAHHIDKIVVFLTFDNEMICLWSLLLLLLLLYFFFLFSRKTSSIEWAEYIMPIDVFMYCIFSRFDVYWWYDALLFGSMNHVTDDQIVVHSAVLIYTHVEFELYRLICVESKSGSRQLNLC